MLTAAGPEAEAEARAAGADLFLTKPFSPLDLLQLVDSLGAWPADRPQSRLPRPQRNLNAFIRRSVFFLV